MGRTRSHSNDRHQWNSLRCSYDTSVSCGIFCFDPLSKTNLCSWFLVDRWGRRVILLSGAIIMAMALSTISYFMYIEVSYTPRMVVIFVIIYNAFFGYSWGPIP